MTLNPPGTLRELTMIFESIADVHQRILSGAIDIPDLVLTMVARIEQIDPAINSYSELLADRAIAQATTLQEVLRRGDVRGPLHEEPLAVSAQFWAKVTDPNPAW